MQNTKPGLQAQLCSTYRQHQPRGTLGSAQPCPWTLVSPGYPTLQHQQAAVLGHSRPRQGLRCFSFSSDPLSPLYPCSASSHAPLCLLDIPLQAQRLPTGQPHSASPYAPGQLQPSPGTGLHPPAHAPTSSAAALSTLVHNTQCSPGLCVLLSLLSLPVLSVTPRVPKTAPYQQAFYRQGLPSVSWTHIVSSLPTTCSQAVHSTSDSCEQEFWKFFP